MIYFSASVEVCKWNDQFWKGNYYLCQVCARLVGELNKEVGLKWWKELAKFLSGKMGFPERDRTKSSLVKSQWQTWEMAKKLCFASCGRWNGWQVISWKCGLVPGSKGHCGGVMSGGMEWVDARDLRRGVKSNSSVTISWDRLFHSEKKDHLRRKSYWVWRASKDRQCCSENKEDVRVGHLSLAEMRDTPLENSL